MIRKYEEIGVQKKLLNGVAMQKQKSLITEANYKYNDTMYYIGEYNGNIGRRWVQIWDTGKHDQ